MKPIIQNITSYEGNESNNWYLCKAKFIYSTYHAVITRRDFTFLRTVRQVRCISCFSALKGGHR